MSLYEKSDSEDFVSALAVPQVVAQAITAWGAALIVAFLSLPLLDSYLAVVIANTKLGVLLWNGLVALRSTSPAHWLPVGLFVFGLVMHAAFEMRHSPHKPLAFSETSKLLPSSIAKVLAPLLIPMWLALSMILFLFYFMAMVWKSLSIFADAWLARVAQVVIAFVLPVVILTSAHELLLQVSRSLVDGNSLGARSALLEFAKVHGLAIFALTMYVIAAVPLAFELKAVRLRSMIVHLKHSYRVDGLPGAEALGQSFFLFACIVIALPTASLLPGGPAPGLFTKVYGVVLILMMIVVIASKMMQKRAETSASAVEVEESEDVRPADKRNTI